MCNIVYIIIYNYTHLYIFSIRTMVAITTSPHVARAWTECVVLWCTDQLQKAVNDLYKTVCRLEEDKYDWELKLRRQTFEVSGQGFHR